MTCCLDYPKWCLLDPWFHICMRRALDTPGFVENFVRVYGLPPRFDDASAEKFVGFIYHFVYSRLDG